MGNERHSAMAAVDCEEPGPMDVREQRAQGEHMRQFILHEAREQAAEIAVKAEADYAKQKSVLMDAARERLQQEYQERQQKIEQEFNIRDSNMANEEKMRMLNAKSAIMTDLFQSAAAGCSKYRNDAGTLATLIRQGLKSFEPGSRVKVRCCKQDEAAVKQAMQTVGGLSMDPNYITQSKVCSLTEDCLGGVILSNQDDTVFVDQTFNARLQIGIERAEPIVKPLLFKEGGSKHLH